MKWYGNALKLAFEKKIDWVNDDIRVALFTTGFTPNQDTDLYFDAYPLTYQVATAGGYTRPGKDISNGNNANKTLTYDSTTNIVKFDAPDIVWSTSTITAKYAVVYDNTPASNKPLLFYFDFGSDKSSSSGDFTIQWNTGGLATIQAGA